MAKVRPRPRLGKGLSLAILGNRPSRLGQIWLYPSVTPFYPGMAPEQELNFLKNQASFLQQQLNAISNRIKEIESAKKRTIV